MPLTPEDVRSKRFTPVRLREGYDMGEVDQFLDEVEAELERLTQENNDLRAKVEAAHNGGAPVAAPKPAETTAPTAPTPPPAPPTPPAPTTSEAQAAATEAGATRTPGTVAEASSAAARLLEIATRNADELVNEAKDQADRIVGEARTKAERLESEAKSKAERVEADARTRAEKLDHETAERRNQLFGGLERERDKLAQDVEELRAFEREYRSRLRSYFEGQLAVLDGKEDVHNAPQLGSHSDEGSGRLRSLLGEES
ncbi:MAG TPA: DivIVA domain-containing protein [Nocardioidaceae bacterium]|nr:DivIVA domain-containing protein [Nocardioidaceae bacterium]